MSRSALNIIGTMTGVLAVCFCATGCIFPGPHDPDEIYFFRPPDVAPDLGDEAPNFTLPTLAGESTVELAALAGGQPVVLVFGSYT